MGLFVFVGCNPCACPVLCPWIPKLLLWRVRKWRFGARSLLALWVATPPVPVWVRLPGSQSWLRCVGMWRFGCLRLSVFIGRNLGTGWWGFGSDTQLLLCHVGKWRLGFLVFCLCGVQSLVWLRGLESGFALWLMGCLRCSSCLTLLVDLGWVHCGRWFGCWASVGGRVVVSLSCLLVGRGCGLGLAVSGWWVLWGEFVCCAGISRAVLLLFGGSSYVFRGVSVIRGCGNWGVAYS